MRKLLLAIGLCLIGSLVFAQVAVGQAILGTTCSDVTYEQAQEILAIAPEDPNGLDADGDGIACEEGAEASGSEFVEPGPADGVCEGSGEGDPDCAAALLESLEQQNPGAEQYETEEAEETETPAPATASEAYSALPDTGGPALLLLTAASVLVVAGLIGVVSRRR